jgi:hypothetical protein
MSSDYGYTLLVNSDTPLSRPSLVSLYNDPSVNRVTGLSAVTSTLRTHDLMENYFALRDAAPRRHNLGKMYFTGHTGVTNSGQHSNRHEEHLAVALRNTYHGSNHLSLPDNRPLTLLDYQVPLKTRRADSGIGKIDLFGVVADTVPCIVELKVKNSHGGRSDTPLRAFLEALAYCAIIEANIEDVTAEVSSTFGYTLTQTRAALMVMAPEDYWMRYLSHTKAGDWWPHLAQLADDLKGSLGIESHFIALRDANFKMGLEGNPPRLTGVCIPVNVSDLALNRPQPVKSEG